MTAAPTLLPVIVGANHRSSSLALRDQLFVEDAGVADFLTELRAAGLGQAVVLSTCDRVEVLTAHPDDLDAAAIIRGCLSHRSGLLPEALGPQLYTLTGKEAVRHCFAVTASLDSLVIGEPQVLGQVKACHRLAREAGMVGPELEHLLQAAYAAAKRVRHETAIAERPVSIASAAVQIARDLHGDLSRCRGLLLGAGDMGELVAEAMLSHGLSALTITAPRASRAEALAATLSCQAAPWERLGDLLSESDVVLAAVNGRQPVLTAPALTTALKKRRRKPMFVVDSGIPGDVEPAVNRIDGAFLYDLTDLERMALEGRATREAAARAAWTIIDADLDHFRKGQAERAAVPAIVALRDRFERVRQEVLNDARTDAEKATRLLIARLLHDPSEVMKDLASQGTDDWQQTEQALKRLFRLE